jgi:hypothetical protein
MGCSDILRPQLAMNRFLPLWPHRFPYFGYIHLGGVGSYIRSLSSIRPICKCRYPTLQQEVLAVAGRSSELACSAEVDPRLADRARLSWARENANLGLGNQSLLSETGSYPQENNSDCVS